MNAPNVRNMTSPRTGRPIANQFIIETGDATAFQSYNTIIALRKAGKVTLDKTMWDFSMTTGKYRNEFLGESITETRTKIKSGEYTLANLNE